MGIGRRDFRPNRLCLLMYNEERLSAVSPQRTIEIERFVMPIINILLTLIVIGILLWLVNTFIPMASSIKTILNLVVVVLVVLWLLNVFGIFGPHYRLGP